jgi:hypothetical protein
MLPPLSSHPPQPYLFYIQTIDNALFWHIHDEIGSSESYIIIISSVQATSATDL